MSFKKIIPYVLIPASVFLAGLSRDNNSNANAQTATGTHTIAIMDFCITPFNAIIDITINGKKTIGFLVDKDE